MEGATFNQPTPVGVNNQSRREAEGAPMPSIAGIVQDLDHGCENFTVEALVGVLEPAWIEEALARGGSQTVRRRKLPAAFTLWTVVLLALFRRHSYVNLLGLLAGSLWARCYWGDAEPPSSSALTQARDRLGVDPVRILFERSVAAFLPPAGGLRLAGRRLMSLDGSTARTPDSEANRNHFGLPGSSRGRSAYPTLRLVTLTDVGSRLTVALRSGPYRTGEMTLARSLVSDVPVDALLVMDRNFMAYAFLWDLTARRGAQFVVRLKRGMSFRTVRRLGPGDRTVRTRIPRALRARRPDLPPTWLLREVTYRPKPGHESIRVLTSIVDPTAASLEQIASAYGQRWDHEIGLDEVKTHLMDRTTVNRPVFLRSMTPGRVDQELLGAFLAHNLVRMLIHRAAQAAGLDPRRPSFTAALERTREAVRDMMALATLRLRERYARLLASLLWAVVPERPGRSNPREVKIKMSPYPCKMTRLIRRTGKTRRPPHAA
jgi:hypothetical protein